MKSRLIKVSFLALSLVTIPVMVPNVVSASNSIHAEVAGARHHVRKIDTKKRVIYLGTIQIAYNSATQVYDRSGNKLDISALKEDTFITFEFNRNQRFINRPTATRIVIM